MLAVELCVQKAPLQHLCRDGGRNAGSVLPQLLEWKKTDGKGGVRIIPPAPKVRPFGEEAIPPSSS